MLLYIDYRFILSRLPRRYDSDIFLNSSISVNNPNHSHPVAETHKYISFLIM
jgi:hypothetical protein